MATNTSTGHTFEQMMRDTFEMLNIEFQRQVPYSKFARGTGRIDFIIRLDGKRYGVELKHATTGGGVMNGYPIYPIEYKESGLNCDGFFVVFGGPGSESDKYAETIDAINHVSAKYADGNTIATTYKAFLNRITQ